MIGNHIQVDARLRLEQNTGRNHSFAKHIRSQAILAVFYELFRKQPS